MKTRAFIHELAVSLGLSPRGYRPDAKSRLLRYRVNRTSYSIVIGQDGTTFQIWKFIDDKSCGGGPLKINLCEPESIDQIKKFI
ncbi:MAG: hypothetical protein ACW963_02585 [Candidatus Sifarchaeia archaeon]|jgi:hypothetical protein